ncbi:GTPase IMAP family member 8-like [Ctenopharyngodon idella]|uniref:GTPase IMAP family member 8-like n=1 Tax=Ctenopharyngodon idella TaxID=7959 RepID=UPI00222F3835|nr:GTPase IMAP family member 8-like [Ctenopharyngodon idella]
MILFTYEREEECDTIIDDLKKDPVLEKLLEKCGRRYQTCNKMMNNQSELRRLMNKIQLLFNENKQCYTGEIQETEEPQQKSDCESDKDSIIRGSCETTKQTETEETHMDNEQLGEEASSSKPEDQADLSKTPPLSDSDSSLSSLDILLPNLSVVLFGNSVSVQFGNENLLFGEKQTNMKNAEISRIVPLQRKISERHVSVIDTIDLHEAEHTNHLIDQLVNENEIHAFIFVVRLGQFTDVKMGLEWLQRVFGNKVLQFAMILFTYEREEECDTIKDDLKKNPVLEKLLEKCGGRYQTCNKMMNNQSEIRRLMNKIDYLFNENKQCYTGEIRETEDPQQKIDCESGEKNRFFSDIFHVLLRLFSNIILLTNL